MTNSCVHYIINREESLEKFTPSGTKHHKTNENETKTEEKEKKKEKKYALYN